MGSGPFAAPTLQALITSEYTVVTVYTKPLPVHARSRTKIAANPVRTLAETHHIPVQDPQASLAAPDVFATLKAFAPDIIIVAAYGKILPQSVLDIPCYGCINIHASLLPRWRGASPIHAAIRAGDTETGVTIMRMDAGLDTGAIIAQKSRALPPHMHTPELFDLLADDGATLLMQVLPDCVSKKILPQPQPTKGITTCRTLARSEGCIDWHASTATIYNLFRAFDPWPGVFMQWQRAATVLRIKLLDITPLPDAPPQAPGTVFKTDTHPLCIATADGAIAITRLQRQGKPPTDATAFINGYPDIFSAHLDKMC